MNELSATASTQGERSRLASAERPIDLVHLARMTFGDRGLEREVLQLFDRQTVFLMERIQSGASQDVPALVHMLKGAARAIGATSVARAAEAVELVDRAAESDRRRAIAELRACTEEACAFIADLLRAH